MKAPTQLPVLQQFPKTRGDCLPGGCNEARPCQHTRCRYHLEHDDNPAQRGRGHGSRLGRRIGQRLASGAEESCALDVADRGETGPLQIAHVMGVTYQQIEKVERAALDQMREQLRGY